MKLVIVESPAKSKTIKKYLGKDYQVLASYGHIRDLLPKEGSVDPNNNFSMVYEIIEKNSGHLKNICAAIKDADGICLATDPDREGEAISWHLVEALKQKGLLKNKTVERVCFHQITKQAVIDAINNPRDLAMDLVNAQQARRALDYLVGFTLSPLMWRKIRAGLSAGRVQSPALRMIVERELEREAFVPQEYWRVLSKHTKDKVEFTARLVTYKGEKLEQFDINNGKLAADCVAVINAAAQGFLTVSSVVKKERRRNPYAPFITSTLQQDAARRLGFTAQRTMRCAQQLYEGIDLPSEGAVGLITYMRTDSVVIAAEAIASFRDYLAKVYGKDSIPEQPNFYKSKSKNSQEAHEAIRPTDCARTPESLKNVLTAEQYKLYKLIWQRSLASQMIHATLDTVAVDLSAGDNIFRANGSVLVDPGFLRVYADEKDAAADDKMLPPLAEGERVALDDLITEQHFTEPPPRYSEASLIKSLEEYDIGRPSTYASIISTLQNRKYVLLENKRFFPTDVGRVVYKFLNTYFAKYVDYNFTASLEDDLDKVSRGEIEWIPLLDQFWQPFKKQIDEVNETVSRKDVTQEMLDEKCPECGKALASQLGKRGQFVGCTGYPDCSYTRSLSETKEDLEVVKDRKCPTCSSDLVVREGKYGKFIGCSAYPNCKFIESLFKPDDTNVPCPKCCKGSIVSRRSRKGKVFYSCANYPKCKYAIWDMPINTPCPKCHWPILTVKETKRSGKQLVCPQEECKYVRDYDLEG
jgi:DNA topoisomerase-1